MRLLRTDTIELQEFPDDATPQYAILSHTWGAEEVSLQDMQQADRSFISDKKGYLKIVHCCAFSKSEGFDYVWIDTCCIDKTSSAELSEAINSMFMWYESAEICYAYLADVVGLDFPDAKSDSDSEFVKSRWFTRGWTLQELIAPSAVVFLNKFWGVLGTRESLSETIFACTGIPKDLLHGTRALETFSVAQRMSWAAGRNTTRIEDRAYSLLGIFGIYMPLIYGEKETAFIRLQEEVMRILDDHSLFAWKSADTRGGVFATSPDAFRDAGNIITTPSTSSSLPVLSSRGIHLELRFKGVAGNGLGVIILNCRHTGDRGIPIGIYVKDVDLTMTNFERAQPEQLASLEVLRPTELAIRKICIRKGRVMRVRQKPGDQQPTDPDSGTAPRVPPAKGLAAYPTLVEAALNGYDGYIWLQLTRPEFEASLTEATMQEALISAITRGYQPVVRVLLSRDETKGDVWDADGVTLLTRAVQCGRPGVVQELLNSGKFSPDLADLKTGRKPLSMAVSYKRPAIVRLLLDSGADFRAMDAERRTPLSRAAGLGDLATVQLLLAARAEVDKRDGTGRTPLSWAADRGNLEVVKLLIRSGADCNGKDNGGFDNLSPFLRAVREGHAEVVQFMIEWGADLNARDAKGRTPLQLAEKRGQGNVIEILAVYCETPPQDSNKDEDQEGGGKGLFKRLLKR